LVMTGLAQLAFHNKANGSLVMKDGKIVGSELIGQNFDSVIYFWSRPSAIGYNPVPSGASNYGPTNENLRKLVSERRAAFALSNPGTVMSNIPPEMIFASASGLDPHISPEAARVQVERVAIARNLSAVQKQEVIKLINDNTESAQFFVLGEPRINVFKLNLALDNMR
jgi:potassium-transporting ATPase KdpC subunit